MAKEDYFTKNFYQTNSSFSPEYELNDVYLGTHLSAGRHGAPTKPDTANQVQQVASLLNQGMIPIEVGAIHPSVFDQIPKQHFKEMKQMAKLAGAKLTVHAPFIDPAGSLEGGFEESKRMQSEERLFDVLKKASDLYDEKFKRIIPVTIHASSGSSGGQLTAGVPSQIYQIENGEKKLKALFAINQENGQIVPIQEETLFYPAGKDLKPEYKEKYRKGELQEIKPEYIQEINLDKGKTYTPEERLKNINETQWDESLKAVLFNKERADEILYSSEPLIQDIKHLFQGKEITPEMLRELNPNQYRAWTHFVNARSYLQDVSQKVHSLFNKAYKYGTEDDKEKLKQMSENYKKDLEDKSSFISESIALQRLIEGLNTVTPNQFIKTHDLLLEKSAETFSNLALRANKELKEKAPALSIENVFPETAFSMGEEMKQLIEKSREKFIEKATKSGMNKENAKKRAEELIGVTFDVGHLNLAKKYGFKDEDLMKEAQKMLPFINKVHLTDNFGSDDNHLPPGMGNVPIKEYLEKIKKQGYKGEFITEAGGFVQHFQRSPFPVTLEALGSNYFITGNQLFFNQNIGLMQGYSEGYGKMLPDIHFQTYGSGFSNLPRELGGTQNTAGKSRLSGNPME